MCFPRQGLYVCICVSLISDLSLCVYYILSTPPERNRSKESIRRKLKRVRNMKKEVVWERKEWY